MVKIVQTNMEVLIMLTNLFQNYKDGSIVKKDDLLTALDILEGYFGEKLTEELIKKMGEETILKSLTECVGKNLTSFVAYPERGEGGSSSWRGNASPKVVEAIVKYALDWKKYYKQSTDHFKVIDPMGGSGTTKHVCDALGVKSSLYDLNPDFKHGKGGWNALKDDLNESADLIFYHPPYHDIIRYSGDMWGKKGTGHPDDLSRCGSYEEFIEKLNFTIKKFYMSLRKDGRLAVLVGDIRGNGEFRSIQDDMMKMGKMEAFIVKAQFNTVSGTRTYNKPFIPIVTEYMVVMQKAGSIIVPFSFSQNAILDLSKTDDVTITWSTLVRNTIENMGGKASLKSVYDALRGHPKAKNNNNVEARIRATIYGDSDDYVAATGSQNERIYKLSYMAA